MARRHIRRRAAGALIATTTALALAACSDAGDAPADEPADAASTPAADAQGDEQGDEQGDAPQGSGPAAPVELGSLGDVVGYGQGYALFGAADADSEPVDGHTTDSQTLADQTGMVTLDGLALKSPRLLLSDAGLFAVGKQADSSLEASWVLARLDPETGAETWTTEVVDPNSTEEQGCEYAGSGGDLVALACAPQDGDGAGELTFLDAGSGEERFALPGAADGVDQTVPSFDPLVVQTSEQSEDGIDTHYGLRVLDPASGDELASHDGVGGGIEFAVDGRLVVSGGVDDTFGTDGDVALVDPMTLEVGWSVGPGDGSTSLLGGGPDGVVVRSSQTDKAVLLDAATGEETAVMDVVDGTIFDRSDGIYPLGDGTYVADGMTSDDSDWMVSLALLFPDAQ